MEDLASKASLNRNQKIGLELFADLDERMDRSEAAEIETVVRDAANQLREGSVCFITLILKFSQNQTVFDEINCSFDLKVSNSYFYAKK